MLRACLLQSLAVWHPAVVPLGWQGIAGTHTCLSAAKASGPAPSAPLFLWTRPGIDSGICKTWELPPSGGKAAQASSKGQRKACFNIARHVDCSWPQVPRHCCGNCISSWHLFIYLYYILITSFRDRTLWKFLSKPVLEEPVIGA